MALDRKRSVRDRGSVRSRGSSSASSSDPREKLKDCCRQFVAFMFTQVGVGALVVSYAIMGAFAFMAIEGESENSENNDHVAHLRSSCLSRLWNVTDHLNVLEERKWKLDVRQVLLDHQQAMALAIKGGYDGRTNQERWTFPSALMFSLSVFTMIGFGHLVPRTQWGKIATMLYAVFGIPVYVLYFMNMGQVLASCFKWFYCKLVRCVNSAGAVDELSDDMDEESYSGLVIVPSTACLWVWLTYLAVGTIMFAEWENWEYLDACYFCVTSLCKIGMGDFVPGANLQASSNQTKLIINFVYLLVGMGIIAMCYNLMKEEILVRLQELKADLIERLQDVSGRMRR
ncbi:hypothetical protein DAPPUDRAFT_324055 [Daphnia pulex]|uniref:Potassium channel domain-containing protein n=1 Tax=Daphnia pulex TaxID=6669 RepID=E9H0K5_DAPPU|nr:hypothetical protein DAPPUDRAFT_324055 [Daphnia pulex]|eukprot:EFX74663.1 hypothetical protein DAPPUDRAFT_324055 [Daphnia pulex]